MPKNNIKEPPKGFYTFRATFNDDTFVDFWVKDPHEGIKLIHGSVLYPPGKLEITNLTVTQEPGDG